MLGMGAGVNLLGNQIAIALLVEVNFLGCRTDFLWLAGFGAEHDLDLFNKPSFQ